MESSSKAGILYKNREDALNDGIPESHIKDVDVITVKNGPFMGRRYLIEPNGRPGRRVKPDMPKAEVRRRLAIMSGELKEEV